MIQYKKYRPYILGALAVFLIIGVTVFATIELTKKPSTPPATDLAVSTPHIQKLLEYAQEIVRAEKPNPVAAARFYAYVAVSYQNTLKAGNNTDHAAFATAQIINQIYPKYLEKTNAIVAVQTLTSAETKSLDLLKSQEKSDAYYAVAPALILPTGPGKWVGTAPFAPTAGTWQRWILEKDTDFAVPPPITPADSTAYAAQLAVTKKAAAERSTTDSALINFWGGTPGTETPSGIWLNRYRDEIGNTLSDEARRASDYSLLSQTLADSFMECWKVKYTYWTERPDMADPSIKTAMKNPPFPGYVSGHSTVSRAAAEVLGALYPEKAALFLSDAAQARDSRLNAGIHLPQDNDQGFILGEKIGKLVLAKNNLKSATVSVASAPVSVQTSTTASMAPPDSSAPVVAPQPALPILPWENTSHESYPESRSEFQSYTNILYEATNSQNADSIHTVYFVSLIPSAPLLTPSPPDLTQANMTDGWKLSTISKDAFWSIGGCASMPTITLANGKYVLIDEAKRKNIGDSNPVLSYVLYGRDEQQFAYLPRTDQSLALINTYISQKTGLKTAVTAGFKTNTLPEPGTNGFTAQNGTSGDKSTVQIFKNGTLKTALYTWSTAFRVFFAGTEQLYFGIGPLYQAQIYTNISFARSGDQKRTNIIDEDVSRYCTGGADGLWTGIPEKQARVNTGDASPNGCSKYTRDILPIAFF